VIGRVSSIYQDGQYVNEGGLAGNGPNFGALITQAATYLDRIFKGARPAELPSSNRHSSFSRAKTAKALGLNVTPMPIGRADQTND
jgi:putative ABC transport system substrate-binding protein